MSSDVLSTIRANAQEADRLHERSRELLVQSVRAGASAGLSQKEIARAINRSQPEVSRLMRFDGRTPLARTAKRNRAAILRVLSNAGARNARVIGSVSRGDDGPDSDLDLLVDFDGPMTLFALARIEAELTQIIGSPVDVVPSNGLKEHIAHRIESEAVPL